MRVLRIDDTLEMHYVVDDYSWNALDAKGPPRARRVKR